MIGAAPQDAGGTSDSNDHGQLVSSAGRCPEIYGLAVCAILE